MESQQPPQDMAPSQPQGYGFLNEKETFCIDDVNACFITDAQLALNAASSAYIKQRIELLEALTGCETKNRYNVMLNFPNGTSAFIFKCKEDSDCCSRNCIRLVFYIILSIINLLYFYCFIVLIFSASDRPMEMKIKYVQQVNQLNYTNYKECDYHLQKPCTCSCFCFSR